MKLISRFSGLFGGLTVFKTPRASSIKRGAGVRDG